MLRASYTYRSKGSRRGRGVGAHIAERDKPRELKELLGVVDRFTAMASDRGERFPPGVEGAHAWMSIIDQGFVMHAYFDGDTISFELYGPTTVGSEKEHSDPYDGSGLSGVT